MRLLTGDEMSSCDTYAIDELGIPSHTLMETAARECSAVILRDLPLYAERGVVVVCGPGNNGGDGFAIARVMLNCGVPVKVQTVSSIDSLKGDSAINAAIFKRLGGGISAFSADCLEGAGVIVDAIFGTGFHGAPRELYIDAIQAINEAKSKADLAVVAIDIASGVDASSGKILGEAVRADLTIAIQSLKLGHVLFPGTMRCGDVHQVEIGVPLNTVGSKRVLLNEGVVSRTLKASLVRDPEAHKGTKGHVLVLGGSSGHVGAAKMSAQGALRSGAGLVTIGLPHVSARVVAPELKEVMCTAISGNVDGEFDASSLADVPKLLKGKKSIVIGPGLGTSSASVEIVREVLEYSTCGEVSLVLDADALNILAANRELLTNLNRQMVLTPHPGEMSRLAGLGIEELLSERLATAERFAADYGAVLVLKGARTIIASPDGRTAIAPAATEVLATGGSGDVLAGIIGALMGRGLDAFDAACVGVYVHGAAGEALSESGKGTFGVIAGDIANKSSKILNELFSNPPKRLIALPGKSYLALLGLIS